MEPLLFLTVNSHDGVLHHGEDSISPDIEADTDEHDRDDKEEALPTRGRVVGVPDDDQRLDKCANKKASRSVARLPADCGKPTGAVTQDLLVFGRGKFRHPVVLHNLSHA